MGSRSGVPGPSGQTGPEAIAQGATLPAPRFPVPVALRVIVVDDLLPMRRLLRRILQGSGEVEVVAEAENGALGLTAVAKYQPDVVITDLHMPVMDGFELARHIRAEHPSTGIVMLTNAFEGTVSRAAFEAGVHAFAAKDHGFDQIVPILRKVAVQVAAWWMPTHEFEHVGVGDSDEPMFGAATSPTTSTT